MSFISSLSSLAWSPGVIAAFMAAGFYVSGRLGFYQLRAGKWIKGLRSSGQKGLDSISPWRAAATALGGALGTGNLSGVAWAVALGGPGAVFWMWVSAFLGMGLSYAEKALTIMSVRKHRGGPLGGAMCYIEKALGRKTGVFYCAICLGAIYTGGCMTQSSAITGSITNLAPIPPALIGLAAAAALYMVSRGGIDRTASLSAVLVPLISAVYIAVGALTLWSLRHSLAGVFVQIFRSAFNIHPAAAGISAVTAMRYGFARGIFSSEAGVGSSTIPHASASNSPHGQGCWGIFEVFLDTIVICTMTGLIILAGPFSSCGLAGEALTAAAFTPLLGKFAPQFVALCITVLAFSTLVSRQWCARQCIRYLLPGSEVSPGIDIVFIVFAFLGSVLPSRALWDTSDALNVMLAVPNLIALCVLSPKAAHSMPSKEKYKFLKK